MSTPPRQTTTIQGIPTAHAVIGEGHPLLMLHGWGANIDLVWSLAERLAPSGYRIYALDMPGFGQTPPPPIGWTVHDYVNFIVDYLDSQDLQRVHLFGHSFGGASLMRCKKTATESFRCSPATQYSRFLKLLASSRTSSGSLASHLKVLTRKLSKNFYFLIPYQIPQDESLNSVETYPKQVSKSLTVQGCQFVTMEKSVTL